MNSLVEHLNLWGERFLDFAGPMFWQSSLLIMLLFAIDFALRRKVRASVRYALWMVVIVKLLLPPTLAAPTGIAWWLRPSPIPKPQTKQFTVTYPGGAHSPSLATVQEAFTAGDFESRGTNLSLPGWFLLASGVTSIGLLTWMMLRWWQVARMVHRATPANDSILELASDAKRRLGLRRNVGLQLTDQPMSPAVCGLFRPVILLPRSLAEQLPPNQLRAVLLHELVHLKRGDVWVNCAQALLQIVYWWHPLLWLANARIRRVREEAVDDAVMLALNDQAECYAPTLLEVAKLAFQRPLASLGLVGILESRAALRQRIERLLNFHPPRKVGFTIASLVYVLAFTALAVPMGEAPPATAKEKPPVLSHGIKAAIAESSASEVSADSETLVTRTLIFDPEVFLPDLRQRMNLSSRSTDTEVIEVLPSFLASLGLSLKPPCTLFCKERGLVMVRAPRAKIEAIERLFTELNANRPQSEIPFPGRPPDRQTIVRKLDQIRIDSSAYNETPLIEVVRDLTWETKKRDPERKGFGYRIKYSAEQGKMVDLSSVKVTVPAFSNVRLSDLLAAVVKGANKSINYYIWAGVAFAAKGDAPAVPRGMTIGEPLPKLIDDPTQSPSQNTSATRSEAYSVQERVGKQERELPPQINIKATFVEVPTAQAEKLLGMVFTNAPLAGTNGFTGILTKPQADKMMKSIESMNGADMLNAPEVTTPSGRQAQIQVVDLQTIVTGINPQALASPGVISTNGVTNSVYQTETMRFGEVLDVFPTVSVDGYSVSLRVIPTVTEFLSYDKPIQQKVYINGRTKNATRPLPRFRVRQTTTTVNVRDGQTLVLGGLSDLVHSTKPNGDTEVKEYSDPKKKQLLVFITPTIIDQAGNRVHSEPSHEPDPARNR